MKKIILIALTLVALPLSGFSHCQIPCGIYDDAARFTLLREHITTLEKSMNEIKKLTPTASNQLVRWVNNKEDHADQFTNIVTDYFLAQRIKGTEPAEKYSAELKLLHQMIVTSMKAKQTTDLEHIQTLRSLVDQFEALYMGH